MRKGQVIPFQYDDRQIRVVMDTDGAPWWVAKDVCEILGIRDHHQAIEILDEDERGRYKIPTPGGNQEAKCISESGLYTLILRSNKPEAKPFRKWVTSEVLPSIRKTGAYCIPSAAPGCVKPDESRHMLDTAREFERTARIFRASVIMAKTAGFKGLQAVVRGNAVALKETGYNCLELLDAGHIQEYPALDEYVSERCYLAPDALVMPADLYRDYASWMRSKGFAPIGRNSFALELQTQYAVTRKQVGAARQRYFTGIALKGGDA